MAGGNATPADIALAIAAAKGKTPVKWNPPAPWEDLRPGGRGATWEDNFKVASQMVPNGPATEAYQLAGYLGTPEASDPLQYGRWNWAAGGPRGVPDGSTGNIPLNRPQTNPGGTQRTQTPLFPGNQLGTPTPVGTRTTTPTAQSGGAGLPIGQDVSNDPLFSRPPSFISPSQLSGRQPSSINVSNLPLFANPPGFINPSQLGQQGGGAGLGANLGNSPMFNQPPSFINPSQLAGQSPSSTNLSNLPLFANPPAFVDLSQQGSGLTINTPPRTTTPVQPPRTSQSVDATTQGAGGGYAGGATSAGLYGNPAMWAANGGVPPGAGYYGQDVPQADYTLPYTYSGGQRPADLPANVNYGGSGVYLPNAPFGSRPDGMPFRSQAEADAWIIQGLNNPDPFFGGTGRSVISGTFAPGFDPNAGYTPPGYTGGTSRG